MNFYTINETNPFISPNYYNLLPYKINNDNLSFIFAFKNLTTYINFYYYIFNKISKKISKVKEYYFNLININDNIINCQINSYFSYIKCFYYDHYDVNEHFLYSKTFLLEDINIIENETNSYNLNESIIAVKSVLSSNNKFFICMPSGENKRLKCYINDCSLNNKYEKIECLFVENFNENFKIFYFNETGEFMATARKSMEIGIFNSSNNAIKICNEQKFNRQELSDDFSIIYNNSINEYILLNYSYFGNSGQCQEIEILNTETTLSNIISTEIFDLNVQTHENSLTDTNLIHSEIYTNLINTETYTNLIDNESYTNLINTETYTNLINNESFINYSNLFDRTIPSTNNNIIQSSIIIQSTDNYIKDSTKILDKLNSIKLSENIIETPYYINTITTNKSKEEIFCDIKNILEDKEIGKNYRINGEDFTIIIKPTNSTTLPNLTYVEFKECEQILRNKYNISNSSIITFFQIEIENDDKNSLYNQIKYRTYDDQKRELDLSLCEEINTKIHYAIRNKSKLDISSISDFKKLGVDILNIKDSFFSDLCYSYSDSNKDMILEDRIKYIYQNYSLCEEGCTYHNIDVESMNIICHCKIQNNDNNSTLFNMSPLFYEQPNDISFFDSNIGVFKCYKSVFSMNNKSNNIGFILFSIFILTYIIFIICFYRNNIKPITKYIFDEMTKNGYLQQNNNLNLNQNNTIKKFEKKKIVSNPIKIKKKRKITKSKKMLFIIQIKLTSSNEKESDIKNIKEKSWSKKYLNNKYNLNNLKKLSKEPEDDDNIDNFGIIKINLNDEIKNYSPKESAQTLHNYTFEEAIKYEKRNIFRVAYIYLLSKQIIFRTFLQRSPLELFHLKFTLFIFMFACDLALNALFYFNDNISRKYRYTKSLFIFAFSNNITVILLSTIIGFILLTLFTNLSNSTRAIRDVFKKEEKIIRKNKNYKVTQKRKDEIKKEIENILDKHKCKIIILFFFEIILMIFYWYYVVVFCHVFSGTQTSWLIDSALSMLSRFVMDFLFCFLFAKIYRIGITSNYECIYKFALFFYGFC